MSRKLNTYKAFRKQAEEETVGRRYHLYEHTATTIIRFNLGGPLQDVPCQLYTFSLHPQCTRAVYRAKKKAYLRAVRSSAIPMPYRTGFGSRARARNRNYGAGLVGEPHA